MANMAEVDILRRIPMVGNVENLWKQYNGPEQTAVADTLRAYDPETLEQIIASLKDQDLLDDAGYVTERGRVMLSRMRVEGGPPEGSFAIETLPPRPARNKAKNSLIKGWG